MLTAGRERLPSSPATANRLMSPITPTTMTMVITSASSPKFCAATSVAADWLRWAEPKATTDRCSSGRPATRNPATNAPISTISVEHYGNKEETTCRYQMKKRRTGVGW